MKWLSLILMIICMAIPGRAGGQHYIGKHKSEVRSIMKENRKDLHIDESSRNPVYNMVKYIDNSGSQTMIYFFSDQDTCLYSKWVCDYSMLNKVMSGLNEKYKQSAEDSWHYKNDGQAFRITLTTGEWFFTITTKPEKQE